jgi:hypothetical protein
MGCFLMNLDYARELKPDRIFVGTVTLFHDYSEKVEDTQYLYITNILTGKAIKLRNPCQNHSTRYLVHTIKDHGRYVEGYHYKRMLFDGSELVDELYTPERMMPNRYYNLVRDFVGAYYLFVDKTYTRNIYYVGEKNIFGVSYGLQDHELIISNTLDGKAIKVENANDHNSTKFVVEFMKTKGVCDHKGEFCLALLSREEIYKNLGVPQTPADKRIKKKIITFISKDESEGELLAD